MGENCPKHVAKKCTCSRWRRNEKVGGEYLFLKFMGERKLQSKMGIKLGHSKPYAE
jgi:hypothetical protein